MKTWTGPILAAAGLLAGCATCIEQPKAVGYDLSCDVTPYTPKADEPSTPSRALYQVQLRLLELREDGTVFTVTQPRISGMQTNHTAPIAFSPVSREVDLKTGASPYRFTFGDGTVILVKSNGLLTADVNVRVFYEDHDSPLPEQPFCRLRQRTSIRISGEMESNKVPEDTARKLADPQH